MALTSIVKPEGFVYRDLPGEDLKKMCPEAVKSLPFKATDDIYTHFPQSIATIRSVLLFSVGFFAYFKPTEFLVVGSFLLIKSHFFSEKNETIIPMTIAVTIGVAARFLNLTSPFAILGPLITTVYATWSVYSSFAGEDPLVSAFYQMAGSKERFQKLPELPKIESAKCLHDWINQTNWNKLDQAVYRAQTIDGRQVMIFRSTIRDPKTNSFVPLSLGVCVFVEKYSEKDNKADQFFGYDLLSGLLGLKNNTFSSSSSESSSSTTTSKGTIETTSKLEINMNSHITGQMANEFFAQLQASKD